MVIECTLKKLLKSYGGGGLSSIFLMNIVLLKGSLDGSIFVTYQSICRRISILDIHSYLSIDHSKYTHDIL